jgi:hypothetical protein
VTYPHGSVITAIDQEVIPVQIGTHHPDAAAQAVIRHYRQVWTPTILLLAPDGMVDHEWNGYLPPALYLAQLLLGLGKAALKQDRLEQAAARFDAVADLYPFSEAAPEALYWSAVARFKGSHDGQDLQHGWARLRGRYPESAWRIKQSFIES